MGKISASLEDYLEAILLLSDAGAGARPKDIAARLKVRAASVTCALKHLAAKKLVNYTPYGSVTLTASGRRVARAVEKKHNALLNFFEDVLGLSRAEAEDFACKMEHDIPGAVLKRLVGFSAFMGRDAGRRSTWRRRREYDGDARTTRVGRKRAPLSGP